MSLASIFCAQPLPAADTQAAPPASAPSNDERTEKAPGLVKKAARSALSDPEREGGGLHLGPFYPGVAIVSAGAAPGPMLHLWTPDLGDSPLDFHASAAYSFYKYQHYDAHLGLLPQRGSRRPSFPTGTQDLFPLSEVQKTAGLPNFVLYASLRHRRYPREHFYGLGPDSPNLRTDYRLRDTGYEVVTEYPVRPWFTVMARGGLMVTSLGPGEDDDTSDTRTVFNEASAPALTRQPDVFHVSAGLLLDNRDQRGNPHRGGSLALAASRFDDRDGQDVRFNRLALDARGFIPLGSPRHVLALRAVTSMDFPASGTRVPFYLQSSLGGSHFLRGFRSFRFTDQQLVAFSGEYRFDAVPKVELALFFDAGEVFRDTGDFALGDMETTWGAGIRFKSAKKMRLRLDLARSRETTRFHAKFSPVF